MVVAIGVVVVVAMAVLLPFFVGKGGLLAESSSILSKERLEAKKDLILQQYLKEEAEFNDKTISKLAWQRRQAFLINRYVDVTRRMDYLTHQVAGESGS